MTTITLQQIAKQVKVSPKLARRRLRNSDQTPAIVQDTRWVFNAKDRVLVAKIIKAA